MQSARVLHEPHGFPQPPPFSLEDSFANYGHGHQHHQLPFDLPPPSSASASLDVADFFPPPSFESMNFFSSNEHDDMLDFLRDFDAADPWEFNPILPSRMPIYPGDTIVEEPLNLLAAADHDQSGIADSSSVASVHSSTGTILPDSQTTPQRHRSSPPAAPIHSYQSGNILQPQASTSAGATPNSSANPLHSQADFKPKPLLSAPQKRMNHVKSEKRRRDTIRDGYLTLTKLLSPSGPGAEQLAIPRRGRPKGSGRAGTGKRTGKGKSGVLFRAVEYIRFMEEGCDSLEQECERLERMILAAPPHGQGYSNVQYGHPW